MLTSGVAEMVSLGAVVPFLMMLTDLDLLWQQPIVQSVSSYVGFNNQTDLLLPITLVFVVTIIVASLIRLENFWLMGSLWPL